MVQEVIICDVDIMYFYNSIINHTLSDPQWRASRADMWVRHDHSPWVTTSRSRPFMTHEKHSTQTTPTNGPCTPTRALGRPVARGRSPGRMPSGYAAPGDAVPVAAPVRARPSPGGHTLQHLPKASRRRKPQAAPCRPRGAVPRVMALHGVAGDVPDDGLSPAATCPIAYRSPATRLSSGYSRSLVGSLAAAAAAGSPSPAASPEPYAGSSSSVQLSSIYWRPGMVKFQAAANGHHSCLNAALPPQPSRMGRAGSRIVLSGPRGMRASGATAANLQRGCAAPA